MTTTITDPPRDPGLYGTVAFQLVNDLLVLLVQRRILLPEERVKLLNDAGEALQPKSDPQNKAMKEMLKIISALSPLQ